MSKTFCDFDVEGMNFIENVYFFLKLPTGFGCLKPMCFELTFKTKKPEARCLHLARFADDAQQLR